MADFSENASGSGSSDRLVEGSDSLRRLVDMLLDETITAEDHAELESLILNDSAARDEYLFYADMHAHLIWLTKGSPIAESQCEETVAAVPSREGVLVRADRGRGLRASVARMPIRWTVGISATVICTLLLVAISQVPESLLGLKPAADYREALWPNSDVNLAIVEDCRDARWRPGAELLEGDLLQADGLCDLESGTVRLKFANGARVVLEGPVAFTVQNAEGGYLRAGRLAAHVPQSAVGFTIDTPASKVIDRGTAFGVEVDPQGVLDVAVFEGAVDLATGKGPQRRLEAGQAGRVASGTFELVSLDLKPFQVVRRELPLVDPAIDIDLVAHFASNPDQDWNHAPYWSDEQAPHAGGHYHVGRSAVASLRTPDRDSSHAFAGDMLTIHPNGRLHLRHGKVPKTIPRLRLAGGHVYVIPMRTAAAMAINADLEVTAASVIEIRDPHPRGRVVLNGSLSGHAPLRVCGVSGIGELTLRCDGGGFSGNWQVEQAHLIVTRADAIGSGHVAVTRGGGFVIRCNVEKPRMRLTLDGGAHLALQGHHLTVGTLSFEGQPLLPGEYSVRRLRELFPHQVEGDSGTVHVTGLGRSH